MLNPAVHEDSVTHALKPLLARVDSTSHQQPAELRVYLEMVNSYLAIYAEYADQIIEHAESYVKHRDRRQESSSYSYRKISGVDD